VGQRYTFTDVWSVPHPLELAWRMVDDVAGWPAWWPAYKRVERVSPDVDHGVGVRWRVWVKADLPYTLDFVFTVVEHQPLRYVKTRVEGFFSGDIDWRLESRPEGVTELTLHEETETDWLFINLAARLGGRRLLEANHRSAMRGGEKGLIAALNNGYVPPDIDGVGDR
jgi:hypothetical protein